MLALPLLALAQSPGFPAFTSTPTAGGGQNYSLSLQTLLTLTALSFLPAVLLMMTGFTRIIIVLSLLRQALGTQSSPPNQVLVGLALFLTFFVMGPVFDKIYTDAYEPFHEQQNYDEPGIGKRCGTTQGFHDEADAGSGPRAIRQALRHPQLNGPEDVPLRILVPSFVTSELKTAFQIGFAVFIPFLIIDMVVASVLMSMGMMMVSPALVALPFKIMLFVLVDGWHMLIGSLAESFY